MEGILAPLVLFSLGEMWSDFNLVLKIFVLITVISFVRNHVGTGPVSWIVVVGFAVFLFGDLWKLFGGIYLIYMLLMFGVSGILIDFFFVGGMSGGQEHGGGKFSPVSSGADVARRVAMGAAARRPRMPMR